MRVATLSVVLLASVTAAMTPVEIKRDYGDAVVTITTYSVAEDAVGLGSGFIVDPSGVIVTCYHVIDGAYPAVVKLLNGASFQDIWVLGCDSAKDVAVIKVKGHNLPAVRLGRSDDAEVGERVVAIGNPKGLENTVSDGLLSGIREMDGYNLLQISAPISPGSSGGPVFNSQGQVIGIAAATLKDGQNLNFCVPMKYARQFVKVEPILTLEEFSRGVREPGLPSSDARSVSSRRQYLCSCIGPLRGFYDAVREEGRGGFPAWGFHLLLAKEKMQSFIELMEVAVAPDRDMELVRLRYLDAARKTAEGFGLMALGMSNGDTWTLDAGIAKAAAAGSDPHKPSPLPSEALVRAYLDDGRVPGDTATRLPAAFDSLPAIFSVTAAGLIQRDSSTGVSRSAVQLSNASTFGFFPDLCLAGIVVYSVTAGSPAAHAGLRKGDVFASARSGTWVFRNMWDWTLFEAMQPTDEPFVFVVKRDGTSVELTATLGKAIH